jgi:predicted CoA-substrate-specific enzyme activase
MKYAGIDIGSRTIEVVILDGDTLFQTRQADTGFDPLAQARELLAELQYDRILATGYGRNMFEVAFEAPTVTEIKAYGVGSRAFFPHVQTILDIGGQDSKAIALNGEGRVKKFEMNDRCAAGTGKFLEVMARTLGFSVEVFGREALKGSRELQINSMCTVFAESEVTSLVAKGKDRRDIALALHRSVVRRAVSMLNRVTVEGELVFAGGVARNPCMVKLLEETLGKRVLVPESPQMVGALGAALLAKQIR